MKNLNYLNKHRVALFGDYGDEYNGAFLLKLNGEKYFVIASNGEGWEHVSVSHKDKIPSWEVMNDVKDMFFLENEVVMQLHPIKDKYINNHKKCLHLWRPINEKIPTPPIWMVGVK